MHYQCLVVDDERVLAESTAEYFNLFDVKTKAVFSEGECRAFFCDNKADLILLDINLKDTSGFDLCRELRKTIQVPILFISARQSDDDILLALNIGGDDYVRKPYSLSVLLAKVKVVLKRYGVKEDEEYQSGRIRLNFTSGNLWVEEQPVKLKAMEWKLFCYLVRNRGRVITKEELFRYVWEDAITGDGTLNVHIRYLREKLELHPETPSLIQTVWGTGYRFEDGSL